MHFPLLACLVTVLGLVSVAYTGPIRGITKRKLIFLNQKNPLQSFQKLEGEQKAAMRQHTGQAAVEEHMEHDMEHADLLPKFNEFFEHNSVRDALAFTAETMPSWEVFAQDSTYKAVTGSLPVYAAFKGGRTQCRKTLTQCLAIVVDGSHGMITTATKLVTQVGNPAIVSFTNWGTTEGPSEQNKHLVDLAKDKVDWLLKDEEVMKALGFEEKPEIVHVDEPLHGPENQHTLSFQFYAGTKCIPRKPCQALVEHTTSPGLYGTRTGKILDYYKQTLVKDLKWTPS